MPKLNVTQVIERVDSRINELKDGADIDTRALNKLLTAQQQASMAAALAANKVSKAKTKCEVQLAVMQEVMKELMLSFEDDFASMVHEREGKAARVFMDAYAGAMNEDKNAWAIANAALTTHGFKRLDDVDHSFKQSTRDMEVRELEEGLRKRFEAEMTEQEREQQRILAEHEASLKKRGKK